MPLMNRVLSATNILCGSAPHICVSRNFNTRLDPAGGKNPLSQPPALSRLLEEPEELSAELKFCPQITRRVRTSTRQTAVGQRRWERQKANGSHPTASLYHPPPLPIAGRFYTLSKWSKSQKQRTCTVSTSTPLYRLPDCTALDR